MTRQYNFTPQWLSGFTQADGSFTVSWTKPKNGWMPIRPEPAFSLSQSLRDLPMMQALHKHLGVGALHINRDQGAMLVVKSLTDITQAIIPLFDAHPLLGGKLNSYLVFKTVVLSMNQGHHKTLKGMLELLKISYFTHSNSARTEATLESLMDLLRAKFNNLPTVTNIELQSVSTPFVMSVEWLVGLIDGDGSFVFAFRGTRRTVVPSITIVMGTADRVVLEAVQAYLGCGTIYDLKTAASRLQITTATVLLEKVLPILEGAHFNTLKQTYFSPSVQAWNIIAEHGVKSDTHLKQVVDLVYNMNQEGSQRKLTKAQYLAKFITES